MAQADDEHGEAEDEFPEGEDDFAEMDGICPRCGSSVAQRPDGKGLGCRNERCVNFVGRANQDSDEG